MASRLAQCYFSSLIAVLTRKVNTALALPVEVGPDAFLGELSTVFGLTRVTRNLKITLKPSEGFEMGWRVLAYFLPHYLTTETSSHSSNITGLLSLCH